MEDLFNKHREDICNKVMSIKRAIPKAFVLHELCVGNIEFIGFSVKQTTKMICITSEKCSIINLDTLEIIFCEMDYDEMLLTCVCEELDFEVISIAGISGGGLRTITNSGETLSVVYPQYPMCKIIYTSDYKDYISTPELANCVYEDYEVKAFGFSRCNNYFVIAGTDLAVFKRV